MAQFFQVVAQYRPLVSLGLERARAEAGAATDPAEAQRWETLETNGGQVSIPDLGHPVESLLAMVLVASNYGAIHIVNSPLAGSISFLLKS